MFVICFSLEKRIFDARGRAGCDDLTVECRWYDGYGVKREAFHETELVPGEGSRSAEEV